jgi:SAM-dependent methyltransferase
MLDDATLDRFLRASHYTDPVDIKKLRFVFRAIADSARGARRDPGELAVLEVACGVGGITLPLATLCASIRALDIDADDVAVLDGRAGELGLDGITATVEDALTFDDGHRYDVVVASEVFEHLVDPGALADVAARHTRAGGVLVVTTPNGYGPWEMWNSFKLVPRRWNWLRRLMGKDAHDGGGGREHEQRYTRGRLVKLFTDRGFELARTSNSDFIFTLFSPLRRSNFFGTLDTKLGDIVPHPMASGWYLAFIKQTDFTEE